MTDEMSAAELLAAYGVAVEEESGDEPRGVLVVLEGGPEGVNPLCWSALGAGRDVADAFGTRVEALILGAGEEVGYQAIWRGADAVVLPPAATSFDAQRWAEIVAQAAGERRPEAILMAGTDASREVAPRAAQRLDTGLVMGVQEVRPEPEERVVIGIVPMYGGGLLGEYGFPVRRPQFFCLAEKAGREPSEDGSREGETIWLNA